MGIDYGTYRGFAEWAVVATATGLAAWSVWTDVRKTEVPAAISLWVAASGAAAWAFGRLSENQPAVSGTVVATVIVAFLFVRGSLNAAYARTVLAFVALFGAFGKAVAFLEWFVLSMVLSVVLRAVVFYVGLLVSESGRSTLSLHWKEGFRKTRPDSATLAAVAASVCYVLAVKAVLGVVFAETELRWESAVMVAFAVAYTMPFALSAMERLLEGKKAGQYAVYAVAAAAVGADVAVSGWKIAASALAGSVAFAFAILTTASVLNRFLKLYMDSVTGKVVPVSELRAGMIPDRTFFENRFPDPSGKSARPQGDVGTSAIGEDEAAKMAERVAKVRRFRPDTPDGVRILKHFPLSPYVLFGCLAASFQIVKHGLPWK